MDVKNRKTIINIPPSPSPPPPFTSAARRRDANTKRHRAPPCARNCATRLAAITITIYNPSIALPLLLAPGGITLTIIRTLKTRRLVRRFSGAQRRLERRPERVGPGSLETEAEAREINANVLHNERHSANTWRRRLLPPVLRVPAYATHNPRSNHKGKRISVQFHCNFSMRSRTLKKYNNNW